MGAHIRNIAFDCQDVATLADFWQAVTGYKSRQEEHGFVLLSSETESGPSLMFNEVPEEKSAKNRVHLDLDCDDRKATVERLEGLGASAHETFEYPGVAWTVMADPEGNEFCIAQHP